MSERKSELDLEEQFFPTNTAQMQRWLPWLRLLNGFRIAIDYRKMFLSLIAVWLWIAGVNFLTVSGVDQQGLESVQAVPWPSHPHRVLDVTATNQRVNFSDALESPGSTLLMAFSNGKAITWPLQQMLASLTALTNSNVTLMHWLNIWLSVLWGLSIAALFGGTISRMTAIDFSGRGAARLRTSYRYVAKRFVSFLGAPLLSLVGLTLCWIPLLLTGVIARIPVLGEAITGVLWIIPMIFGFLAALLIVGIIVGWPFMVAAVGTEGSDAFDALSRSFSYVFNRPWYALFLVVFTMLYGSVLLYFVTGMVGFTIDTTLRGIEAGYGDVFGKLSVSPEPWTIGLGTPTNHVAASGLWGTMFAFWFSVILSLPVAFVYSFFWTASTIIYLLLRRREDGTPLDEIDSDESSKPLSSVPLVGMAAAAYREKVAPQNPPTDS